MTTGCAAPANAGAGAENLAGDIRALIDAENRLKLNMIGIFVK
jgi:hypothetical protein